MSNVVKMTGKKKRLEIDKWAEITHEHSEKMFSRLYDQIKVADIDAVEADIPEEVSDRMIIGVIATLLVTITHARDVISPWALLKLVEHEIMERVNE